ncbi:membrane protein insertion efficiency factor YidD [Roseateles sp.]|uniref:membrane protein insertion efficiency factor YidD n=1 Tax=Roseateles sp. TaxID=1971397 RepID=UPI003D1113C0
MRRLLLYAIRLYQRYVSPHKGFVCAYRVHTGRRSCSALGLRAVRRYGVVGGLDLIRQRTARCGQVHRRYGAVAARRPLAPQRGDCDLGCDLPCDLPCDLHGPRGLGSSLCDVFSCDCGGGSEKKQDKRRDGKQRQSQGQGFGLFPPSGRRDCA